MKILPKIAATEETLGELHDELDTAVDMIDTVFHALIGLDLSARAVATVVDQAPEWGGFDPG